MTARSSAAFVAFLIFAAGGTAHAGWLGERNAEPVGAGNHEQQDNHDGRFVAAATYSF